MPQDNLKTAIDLILATKEVELDCDECFARLSEYAEVVEKGAGTPEIWREVEFHLRICPGCHEEFQALLRGLQEFPRGER